MVRAIEAVLKISERCNIDCTYCYFFNHGSTSYSSHPPYMSEEVMRATGRYLNAAAEHFNFHEVRLDFHGGEPLMIGKERFEALCEIALEAIDPAKRVVFAIQTNAMLVDAEWLELFEKYQFSVGVSIDGDKDVNDSNRVDKNGRGTYDRTVMGLEQLKRARAEGRIPNLGVLAVATSKWSGRDVFDHIVDVLGIDSLNLLLPINTHDTGAELDIDGLGRFLCDAFDAWAMRHDPTVTVRLFTATMSFLVHAQESADAIFRSRTGGHPIITVASNGDIGPDDTLSELPVELFSKYNVASSSFLDFWNSEEMRGIVEAEFTLSSACGECCWRTLCRGGAEHGRLLNRFSASRGFNNPSVICEALRGFYSHVSAYLLREGMAFARLERLVDPCTHINTYSKSCSFAARTNTSSVSDVDSKVKVATNWSIATVGTVGTVKV